jgi:tetratricopeptide (TPR) repeat protein
MSALAVVVAVALLGAAPSVDNARRFSDDAKRSYDLGRFDDARRAWERAYEEMPLPAFLFNLGQCHFQLGNYDKAIFLYERYLELEPHAENRRLVKDLIAEAKARARAAAADDDQRMLWFGVAGSVAAVVATSALVVVLASPGGSPIFSASRLLKNGDSAKPVTSSN